MYYVYVLKSTKVKEKFYIGITNILKRRIQEHANPDNDQYTYRYAPWELETYLVLKDLSTAKSLEAYLKTSSGRTFIRRHLVS